MRAAMSAAAYSSESEVTNAMKGSRDMTYATSRPLSDTGPRIPDT